MDRHPHTSPIPSHLRTGPSDRDSLPSKLRSASSSATHLQSPAPSRPASTVSTATASPTPSLSASTRTTGYRHSSVDSASSSHSRPPSYTPSYMNAVPARKPAPPSRTPTPSGLGREGSNGHGYAPGQNGSRSVSASGALPADNTPPSQQQQQSTHRTQSSNHHHHHHHPVKKGTLLLLTASTLHPRTQTHLETMLRRGSYSNIGILGPSGQLKELKDLKIQIYALLGKLSHSSVGVEVRTWDTQGEGEGNEGVVAALAEIWKLFGEGEAVNGVLCQPAYTSPHTGSLMTLPTPSLRGPWATSVAFVHTVASTVIPRMRANAGLFAVTGPVGTSAMEAFYKSAVESLVEGLGEDAGTEGVALVRAENVLAPEPWEREGRGQAQAQAQQQRGNGGQGYNQGQGDGAYGYGGRGQRHQQQGRPVNGIQIPAAKAGAGPVQSGGQSPDDDFMGGESPTKLYSMWALHEQLGAD